jgi:hypothetical protein
MPWTRLILGAKSPATCLRAGGLSCTTRPRIECACKAETRPRIPIVTHEIGGTQFSKLRAGLEANLAASSSSTMANGCRITVSAFAYNRQDAFITPLASAV